MGTKSFSIATEAPVPSGGRGGEPGKPTSGGFGSGDNLSRRRTPNHTYQTGTWLFIAAVTMMFAGFTSTTVVRQSTAPDWGHVPLPSILYMNTVVLLISSITFELARRAVKRSASTLATMALIYGTLALGLLFVGGQLYAWQILAERGVYLASNPSSSTFYLLTAAHALHLCGGVLALTYIVGRMDSMKGARFRACLSAAALYWHFMAVLWLYILLLLVMRG